MKTLKTRWLPIATALSCAAMVACAPAEDKTVAPTDSLESTGMALSLELSSDDVAGFQFTITPVDCDTGLPTGEDSIEAWEDLEDMDMPTGLIDGVPFADDSSHPFADHFEVLLAGCYDVEVWPTDDDMEPLEGCSSAQADNVEVFDGETTEIVLLSQCEGGETGALDVIASINTEPTIVDLEYNPSKFNLQCAPVEICVTAVDPDNDPLEFVWSGLGDDLNEIADRTREDGEFFSTECITIEAEDAGSFDITVTVYDLFEVDGELVRAEDWLNDNGYTGAESNDSLTFPLHIAESDLECEGQVGGQVVICDVNAEGGPMTIVIDEDDLDEYLDAGSYLGACVPKVECKVKICFNGETLRVDIRKLGWYLYKGARLGKCHYYN